MFFFYFCATADQHMLATSTGELKAAPVVMYIVHYTVLVPETKGLKIC